MGYPSDLKEKEWLLIEPCFQAEDRRGSACKHPRKQIIDAILYVVKGGIPWRLLPKDFPPWKTVYDHFSRWNRRGVWETTRDALNALRRKQQSRKPQPNYGIIDSQSAKTLYASEERSGCPSTRAFICASRRLRPLG